MSGKVGDNFFRSSGVIATSATEYDDDQIQSNIAMLGFYVAVNGSLVRYNLVDQSIDEFFDTSGVDASASTNEARVDTGSGANFYYVGESASTPTGADSEDTSITGFTTMVMSSASGSIVVGGSGNATMLVVAGGGSGGGNFGGGGGAGGLIYKVTHALTAQTYNWVRGDGGAGITTGPGNDGVNSTWTPDGGSAEFTAIGGGNGGDGGSTPPGVADGGDGGSGGGSGYQGNGGSSTQGTQPGDSGTYGFGFDGGDGFPGSPFTANPGGSGGAGSIGLDGSQPTSGNGGAGRDYSLIFGTAVGDSGWFASGGGGGWTNYATSGAGTAGPGGGTAGGTPLGGDSAAAQALTGGGSGGGADGSGATGNGGSGILLLRYADGAFAAVADLTLQSTDVTALSAPTYAEFVTLTENAAGTATLNTDIKGYISRDSGTTFTQGTLVDEGTWGTNKKILGFHDLDISGQPSSTSMCYKITTHNQSAAKETRIYATSIGWR